MLFEGSEKKVEIVFAKGQVSLRDLPVDYWKAVVKESHATVLSIINNDDVDAYLLSESSLFVWNDRITMLTCGTTTLVQSAIKVINDFPKDALASVIFQRKNEYFGHLQKTNFMQDRDALLKSIPGKSMRFGRMDDHHHFLFHLDKEYAPEKSDVTTELLMSHINSDVSQFFCQTQQCRDKIRNLMKLDTLFAGYQIDDFVFQPHGYSMNAIKGDKYATFHITPEEGGSYVSFETNEDVAAVNPSLLMQIIDVFKPQSFDVVTFNTKPIIELSEIYRKKTTVKETLQCGYDVTFSHYYRPIDEVQKPYNI